MLYAGENENVIQTYFIVCEHSYCLNKGVFISRKIYSYTLSLFLCLALALTLRKQGFYFYNKHVTVYLEHTDWVLPDWDNKMLSRRAERETERERERERERN